MLQSNSYTQTICSVGCGDKADVFVWKPDVRFRQNRKAFTLIEAVFSVLISSMLFYWVFSYFSDSMRGVAHSEDSLETIREIQNLTTRLKYDLYEIRPWAYPRWREYLNTPVDIYKTTDNLFLDYRNYEHIVNQTHGLNSSSPIDIQAPHRKQFTRSSDGTGLYTHYVKPEHEHWDSWFRSFFQKPENVVLNFQYISAIENSFVVRELLLDEPFSQTVAQEYFFDCSGQDLNKKCSYRFYDYAGKDQALHYVVRYSYDDEGIAQETGVYGRDADGFGRISSFRLTPVFEHATGYEEPTDAPHLCFLRFFINVDIEFKGQHRGFGPEGRTFRVSFSVMSPALNSSFSGRGYFPVTPEIELEP